MIGLPEGYAYSQCGAVEERAIEKRRSGTGGGGVAGGSLLSRFAKPVLVELGSISAKERG